LTIEFFTSVAVGGDAGLSIRGTVAFTAVAAGSLTVVRVDVVAENAVPAKSKSITIGNCIIGKESERW
jgi:hypothetical protein